MNSQPTEADSRAKAARKGALFGTDEVQVLIDEIDQLREALDQAGEEGYKIGFLDGEAGVIALQSSLTALRNSYEARNVMRLAALEAVADAIGGAEEKLYLAHRILATDGGKTGSDAPAVGEP